MGSGTFALMWLILVPATDSAPPRPLNTREIKIPINVDPAQRDQIRELVLFWSSDHGQTWNQGAQASPSAQEFQFKAPADGEYWFKVRVNFHNGRQEPENIYSPDVGKKIIIDTVRPDIRLTADRVGDQVVVNWDIHEERPLLGSLKLEYRTSETPPNLWLPVPTTADLRGQSSFRPGSMSAVTIRMQMHDQAGNIGEAVRELPGVSNTMLTSNFVTSPPTPPPAPPAPAPVAPAPPAPVPATQPTFNPHPPVSPAPAAPAPVSHNPFAPVQPPGMPGYPSASSDNQVLARSDISSWVVTPGSHGSARSPTENLPPLRLVNSRLVSLEYEVRKCGPSGLGSVELYMTRDDGRTWQLFKTEQISNQPSPGHDTAASMSQDPRRPQDTQRRTIQVELPGEGVYGFYVVVKSGAGRGRGAPQEGELPQMRLEVDLTPPRAELFFKPKQDQARSNVLVLGWHATDKNLEAKPISLEWSDPRDKVWKTIARDLPNTGSYPWVLPDGIPPNVYLRLVARDTAGNVGIAETAEPVSIDLTEPDAVLKAARPEPAGR